MHLILYIIVWIELLINKRYYEFEMKYFVRYVVLMILYLGNNFILGHYFEIYPYKII